MPTVTITLHRRRRGWLQRLPPTSSTHCPCCPRDTRRLFTHRRRRYRLGIIQATSSSLGADTDLLRSPRMALGTLAVPVVTELPP